MLKTNPNNTQDRIPPTTEANSATADNRQNTPPQQQQQQQSMDTLKTTFLPNLSMDAAGLTATHFCPICGQQFERSQHVAEHMQICHGTINVVSTGAGGLLLAQHHNPHANEALKIDYPCLSCDEKYPTAHELDEHTRLVHQTPAFLARCLACGIYGISSTSLQEGDEYKCMHCGTICTAASLAGHNSYLEQQQHHHQQQQQQPPSHTPDHLMTSDNHMNQMNAVVNENQQHQQQQQHQLDETSASASLRVPPLTVKLNKDSNSGETHPQVIIKQEPICINDGDLTPTSVPVYTIQQQQPSSTQQTSTPVITGVTSVVVSTATAAGLAAAAAGTSSTNNIAVNNITTTLVGNKVRHKCPECPKTFKTPGTLAMHRKIHTGEAEAIPKQRPYICTFCGKAFTQSNTLKQHTRIHTGEKPYHCGYCEKSFSVKDYLTKHIRTHTGEKPYTCPHCDKRFTQRSALTVHTTKLHPL